MGFMAPFYIAGLLAVGLPILFHLIRRNPSGRQLFSSLMFLTPSPPTLTKRSRLTNILLLILRALAITILAFAFSRPFFHQDSDLDNGKSSGRRIALLVDTSASMKRGDLWKQANAQVEAVLSDLTPLDDVGLFMFDRRVRPVMTFEEWRQVEAGNRAALLRSRMAAAEPTWGATRLGDALATTAGIVAEHDTGTKANDKMVRQVVLISDLQQGSHAEALQGHEWPKGVVLEVKPVALKEGSNASLQWVEQTAEEGGKPDTRLRVRVANEAGSTKEQFVLRWANAKGVIETKVPVAATQGAATQVTTAPEVVAGVKVYVAPGHAVMVRVPWLAEGGERPDRLVLQGDDFDFDNTLYVVAPRRETVKAVYVGDDGAEDLNGLRYYLQSAFFETARRKVEIAVKGTQEAIADADLQGARLVVVAGGVGDETAGRLKKYIEGGGDVLWVMKDVGSAQGLAAAGGMSGAEAEEAVNRIGGGGPESYALISRVDTEHPLFAPFADVRFGDFTKIHIWKHRRVKLGGEGNTVLAWLDNGDPFLVERAVGKGRLRVMTAGWQPGDSQLALSTKFVPLLEGMLQRRDRVVVEGQYAVGEPIALPAGGAGGRVVVTPAGKRVELAAGAATFEGADAPGVYALTESGEETPLAVNLPADESRTVAMGGDELERWGAVLGGRKVTAEQVSQERKLRMEELESHQKLWRWLILSVLGLLAVETVLAGRVARRTQKEQANS